MKALFTLPQISVVLPFFNAENTLHKAIESIQNQTFSNWELILVNNASTDKSPEIAKLFSKKDNRIIIVNEPKKGIVEALNTGLSYCKAPYIARMDADDISLPSRLELQYNFMHQNTEVDLCSGLVQHFSETENNTSGYKIYVDWINKLITHQDIRLNQFVESPLAHPSVMFRKQSLKKYGTYSDGDFPEDYEMWLRWLNNGAQFFKLKQEILIWYDSPDRLSRNDSKYSKVAFNKTRIYYLDKWLKKNNPFYPHLWIWGAGKIGKKLAKQLSLKGHQIISFIDICPKKAKQKNCIHYSDIPKAGHCFIVNFVATRGTATLIKNELFRKNYTEGKDFIMAAGL